jgi:hypothetical protein
MQAGGQAKKSDARLHNLPGLYDPGRHVLPVHVTAETTLKDVHIAMAAMQEMYRCVCWLYPY